MTQEQTQGQAPASETTPQGAATGEEKKGPTVEELLAQLETERADKAKLKADNEAIRKGQMRQKERDEAVMSRFEEEAKATRSVVSAALKALVAGDAEEASRTVQEHEEKYNQAASSQRFVQRANAMYEQLMEVATGDDGNPIVDVNKAEELADARALWADAMKRGDLGDIATALADATKAIHRIERQKAKEMTEAQAKKAAEDTKKAAEEARKKALEGAEALDTDTGRGGSAGAVPSLEVLAKKNTRNMTPQQLREHSKQLDAAMRRGR